MKTRKKIGLALFVLGLVCCVLAIQWSIMLAFGILFIFTGLITAFGVAAL